MRSINLGKYFGIGVFIHWTFFLLPLYFVILYQMGQIEHLAFHLALLCAVFGCVILHEFGHALTARLFGIGTRDITLYPIGGVARLDRMSEKPGEEIAIAIAGPLVNVAIIIVLLVGGFAVAPLLPDHWIPSQKQLMSGTPSLATFWVFLIAANAMLVIFNMIPAFPMDGGRVFRAVLSLFMDRLPATRIAATLGMVLALGLAALLFMQTKSPFIIVVAVFVALAGQAEVRYLQWKKMAEDEEGPAVRPYRSWEPNDYHTDPRHPPATSDGLLYQPKVYVWTRDSRTGMWAREEYRGS